MKANELMLGDWIHNSVADITFQVYPQFFSQWHNRPEQFEATIQPIPLTPGILEKNGFHEKSSGVFVCEKFNTLPDYDWFCVYRMLNGKTYLEINSFISGLGTFSKSGVQYVHELQHALRLCGIDKNIEI